MKLAICSDVHGNYRRLNEFRRRNLGIPSQDTYVLGDIVQWGTTFVENRCVNLVRTRGYNVVSGNHDQLTSLRRDIILHQGGIDIMDRKFYPENIDYLRGLPRKIKRDGVIFAHSLPIENQMRIKNQQDAHSVFPLFDHEKIRIAFIGHNHCPFVFAYNPATKQVIEISGGKVSLNPNLFYLVNPGTLGLGKTGSFILFDTSSKTVERKELN